MPEHRPGGHDRRQRASRDPIRPAAAWALRWRSGIIKGVVAILVATLGIALFLFRHRVAESFASWTAADAPTPLTAVARVTSIPYRVLAGGELLSARAVEVVCEVEGTALKVVEMIPEGTQVRAGDVVIQLDPSEINDRHAQQRITVTQVNAAAKAAAEELKIQRNLAASAIAEAQLTVTLAELDRRKYLEGEYQVELNDLRGSIALAETDLQDAHDMVDHYEKLVRKGFRTPEQLEAKVQAVERARYALSRDQEKLQVLERFTKERQQVELTAKAEETIRELERVRSSASAAISKAETDLEVAIATAELEREQLQRIEEQLKFCELRAPVDGTVIYAKDKNKKIELGEAVRFKQLMFSLPELSEMKVMAFVHESEIQQVQTGMPAKIRVDAFPDLPLAGEVVDIATYYDATRHWLSGGVKEYATTISIDGFPADAGIKPGMTAQVTIQVGQLSDGVIVPVAAVAQQSGRYYCFRQSDERFDCVEVKLGKNTENYVEVLTGLGRGDAVALDSRSRLAAHRFTHGQDGEQSVPPAAH
ncbi:efflux RND transporter periplasmic adaptor subunit [Stieleria sp. ICT_E10.1]|uniref:efflux RND transporter periplasmic adaptor subunit n=1 Tax=Stieleria sedimenti TaxID=2976331 RepID=UPI00217F682F|nr:efflux RND transporter periplasmic adaptor subunit [Stieleria sedimenti]MCS7468504.1 efflux RND transporter periplasmic adaptor subunit [Stieleria sedimenti]